MATRRRYYGASTVKTANAIPYIVLGWVFAVISLFMYSFLFGIIGVTMGIISTKKENRAGIPVIIASIVFMSIGLIYGPVLMTQLRLLLKI